MAANFALPDTFDSYRPFGGATQILNDVPCRIVPNLYPGEVAGGGADELKWSHYLDLDPGSDIRDGSGRVYPANSFTYADGDEVRATLNGLAHKFVVVWVEQRYTGTANAYTRAYLMRDTVTW